MKNIFLLILVLTLLCVQTCRLNAQWIRTNGPFGGFILSFTSTDSILFAGSKYGSVWKKPLSETITNIKFSKNEIPLEFREDVAYKINRNGNIL